MSERPLLERLPHGEQGGAAGAGGRWRVFRLGLVHLLDEIGWIERAGPQGRETPLPDDLPPSAIPVFKLGIYPQTDQPCAVAEA